MKLKYSLTIIITLLVSAIYACPVCEKQQPSITMGLTHGAGPESNWDWVIISIITLVTLLTLFYSVKYLVKPGERKPSHIKHLIIQ